MNGARLIAMMFLAAAVLTATGCGSFSRKVNQALPDFLRSDPGEEEIQRYQQRVRVLNRSEGDLAALEAAFADANQLFDAEEWGDAATAYEDFLENFPDSKRDEEVRYKLVLSHRNDEEAFETSQALKKFLKRYPISEYNKEVEELAFTLASEYVDGEHDGFLFGNQSDGVALFREQITNFPNGIYAADAYWKLGNHFYDEGEYFDAAAAYDTLVEKYGESKWAGRALYNRALTRMTQIKGIEYDQKVMELAVADFRSYLRDFPEADRREDAQVYIERIENMMCEKQIDIARWYASRDFPGSARYVLTRTKAKLGHTEAAREIDGLLADLPADEGLEVQLPSNLPAPDRKITTPAEAPANGASVPQVPESSSIKVVKPEDQRP